MNTAITAYLDEMFPEVMACLEGELTMENMEAAMKAAMDRRAKLAQIYLNDAEAQEKVNRAMFASAYADVARADAYRAAIKA
jgi:hypothetical protein